MRTCLEKWKKNKWIEACVSWSKVGIENLLKLFQLTTPPQTNGNDLSQNIKNSESSNEIDSHWHNAIVENEQLPHSNTVDLSERQSEVIGGLCIGPATMSNTGPLTKTLRAKDKRPRKRRECSWYKMLNNNQSYEWKWRGS